VTCVTSAHPMPVELTSAGEFQQAEYSSLKIRLATRDIFPPKVGAVQISTLPNRVTFGSRIKINP
jgi:hypothetical protein